MCPLNKSSTFVYVRRALTIAGSDSCGGAGIAADLQTFTALGVHGMCAITALTAQNTYKVKKTHTPPVRFLYAQLESIWQDMPPHAFKTGMLAQRKVLQSLRKFLDQVAVPPWVLDPVMVATSGAVLLEKNAIRFLQDKLFPLATLITPNLPEAASLIRTSVPSSESEFYFLGERLSRLANTFWLLKGGHLGWETDKIIDALFYQGSLVRRWEMQKLFFPYPIHGSGCTLSAAICAFLAKDIPLEEAVEKGLNYLRGTLEFLDPMLAHGAVIPNRSYLCIGT